MNADYARLGSETLHEHTYQGQKLRHSHPDGDVEHGYYEHPEDFDPAAQKGLAR